MPRTPYTLVPPTLVEEIDTYAGMASTQVTIRQLYEVARNSGIEPLLLSAQFLHREIPIRCAQKVKQLESIPDGLANINSIQVVRDWYVQSFRELIEAPFPATPADERHFRQVVTRIKNRHKNQVPVMARGIRQFMLLTQQENTSPELQHFLDSFYCSRIGIRVLLGHYIAMHEEREGWYGIICAQTSVAEVAESAAESASSICRHTLGEPPPVRILGRTSLRFKYIPSHLHLMLFELLKNSFRAVAETHGSRGADLPPVDIVIAGGVEDVSIKVDDQGGGIPRSGIDNVFAYAFTTAPFSEENYNSDNGTLAGLGYGLPLCRLYARYFGGDLQVISLEGYGTDAFLHLNRLGNMQEASI